MISSLTTRKITCCVDLVKSEIVARMRPTVKINDKLRRVVSFSSDCAEWDSGALESDKMIVRRLFQVVIRRVGWWLYRQST